MKFYHYKDPRRSAIIDLNHFIKILRTHTPEDLAKWSNAEIVFYQRPRSICYSKDNKIYIRTWREYLFKKYGIFEAPKRDEEFTSRLEHDYGYDFKKRAVNIKRRKL